jgi:hypothetical protein
MSNERLAPLAVMFFACPEGKKKSASLGNKDLPHSERYTIGHILCRTYS